MSARRKRDRRESAPYGVWQTRNGREILFNRDYRPLWQRRPGQPAEPADPDESVLGITRECWFFGDADAPHGRRRSRQVASRAARQRCEAALEAFLKGRPIDPAGAGRFSDRIPGVESDRARQGEVKP